LEGRKLTRLLPQTPQPPIYGLFKAKVGQKWRGAQAQIVLEFNYIHDGTGNMGMTTAADRAQTKTNCSRLIMGKPVLGHMIEVSLAELLPDSEHSKFLPSTRQDALIFPTLDTCAIVHMSKRGLRVLNPDSFRESLRACRLSLAQPCFAFAPKSADDVRALAIGLPATHKSRIGHKEGFTDITRLLLTTDLSVDQTHLEAAKTLQFWSIGKQNLSADKSLLGVVLPQSAAQSISKSTIEQICREHRLLRRSRSKSGADRIAATETSNARLKAAEEMMPEHLDMIKACVSDTSAPQAEPAATTVSSNPAVETFHHCLSSQSWPAFTARFTADLPTSQRNAEAETTSILHSVLISSVDAVIAYLILALEKPKAPVLISLLEEVTGLDKLENCVDRFLEECEYTLDVVFDKGATLKESRMLCELEKSKAA